MSARTYVSDVYLGNNLVDSCITVHVDNVLVTIYHDGNMSVKHVNEHSEPNRYRVTRMARVVKIETEVSTE